MKKLIDYSKLSKAELIQLLSKSQIEKEILDNSWKSKCENWKLKYEKLEADFKALQIKNNQQLKELEILKEKTF